MKLYLVGLPGSGKSYLGKNLAEEIKIPFIDLDHAIEEETGTSIGKIFSEKGEDYFRDLEAVALRRQSEAPDFVMACGGGTPCFHNNMKFINESGKSIFLNTPLDEIVKRLASEEKLNRPLLEGTQGGLEDRLKNLLRKRISFYDQAAITLTGDVSTREILRLVKS